MAILNFEHIFEQADNLVVPPPAGAPRQVDLRRAISSAYYGLFHFTVMSIADEFVGVTERATCRYALFYRAIDHRQLRDICLEAKKQTPTRRFADFVPLSGWGGNIQAFAAGVVDLQEKRHTADYDPRPKINTSDTKLAILTARSAVQRFQRASKERRRSLLTLLVCPPR